MGGWVGGGCVAIKGFGAGFLCNNGLLARELVPRVELSPGIITTLTCNLFISLNS